MANHYFLNLREQPEGEHEVHTADCKYRPAKGNSEDLGYHTNSVPAVEYAQKLHPTWSINGCIHCCPETNTD